MSLSHKDPWKVFILLLNLSQNCTHHHGFSTGFSTHLEKKQFLAMIFFHPATKKKLILSIESWLVSSDAHNGLL